MQTFYLLVFAAGLLAAHLLLQVLKAAGGGYRRAPAQRRSPFLTAEERLCLATIDEAVGNDFRVFAKVALGQVLEPDEHYGRRRQRRMSERLRGRVADFLVCSGADGHPLCAVIARTEPMGRAVKREVAELDRLCAEAGLPVVTLALRDRYELHEIRRRLLDAVDTADVRVAPAPVLPAADEEALLAELAASMQEPDAFGTRRLRGQR